MTRDRFALVLVGFFLLAVAALVPAWRLSTGVRQGTVVACRVEYSHGPWAMVTLNDGRSVALSWEDIPDPARCQPVGATIAKLSGDLDYRVDGRPFRWPHRFTFLVMGLVGMGLIVAARIAGRLQRR
jgi:hypothetical protein